MPTGGVRAAFNRAAPEYGRVATTQRMVMNGLFELACKMVGPAPGRILDAGCGPGSADQILGDRWPSADIVDADFAERMLQRADSGRTRVCANLEQLPIRDRSIDLYWSNFAFQWCSLTKALAEARRVLALQGVAAISTLAELTFAELRTAFAGIDSHHHTLLFDTADRIEHSLRANGFIDVAIDRRLYTEYHPDFRTLLHRVKETGANQVSGPRRPGLLGRRAFQVAESRYEEFREAAGLPLRYDVLLITAKAP